MNQFKELVRELIEKFDRTKKTTGDRTGVGTVKVVGRHLRFDLSKHFPQLTLKKTVWKSMVAELLWFLTGSTDNALLELMGCKFWRPWAVTEKDIVLYYLKNNVGHEAMETYRELTTRHEVDWVRLMNEMIESGAIPADAVSYIGQLGPIYSKSWVDWNDIRMVEGVLNPDPNFTDMKFEDETGGGTRIVGRTINQIQNAVDLLKKSPNSRRIIVSAWDPRHIPEDYWPDGTKKTPQENVIEGRASLAFCHSGFQFVTEELAYGERCALADVRIRAGDLSPDLLLNRGFCSDEALDDCGIPRHRINCLVTIRSSDTALGLPVNIASYALLTHMFAQVVNMAPGELIINTGDSHLYTNQIEPMRAILEREPLTPPTLWLNPEVKDIFAFTMNDIRLDGYEYHDEIKMDVAV